MAQLGIDRSHYNAPPNYALFKAAGGAFVIAKATEGTGWSDPAFAACRAGTEAAGLVFGSYHFARWTDPIAEARYYLSVASPRPGELVALDDEAAIPAGVDVVAWTMAFCSTVHAATGAWPFVYMNQAWLTAHDWASVAANDGLWLARYDNQPTGGPIGQFPVLAIKQFTDRGTVAGQPGTVDVDEFQGDLAALLRYAVPANTPAPTPEADVQLTDTISFTRPDNGQVTTFSVAEYAAWTNWYAGQAASTLSAVVTTLATIAGQVAAQNETLAQLAGGAVDMAAVQASAQRGAADALSKLIVTVTGAPAATGQ